MAWISENACPVWYDDGIHAAARWRDEVAEKILGSSLFLIYLSPASVVSEECLKELNFALDHGIAVLPVIIEAFELPPGLKLALLNRQAVERYRFDLDTYRDKVRTGITDFLGTSDEQTRHDRFAAARSNSAPRSAFVSHYELHEKVAFGATGTIYRATDRVRQSTIAVKRGAVGDAEDFGLADELKVLAGLRHPNIVVAVDYGFEESGREFLALQLSEGTSSLAAAAARQPISLQLDYLSQGLRALNYLHHKGLLHGALHPDSIVVLDGRLKLIDFGYCCEADSPVVPPRTEYLAPEVMAGADVSVASDLYSFGLVVYESFMGAKPELESLARPEEITDKLLRDGFDEPLARVFGGLLAPDPEQRFASAVEAFAAISEDESGEAIETALTRESALQTGQFVGRKAELGVLRRALEAAKRGRGGTVLISGESGVGKSRLVNEMETMAMIEGFRTMHGQAVDGDAGSFRVWSEVARHYDILMHDAGTDVLDADSAIDKDSFLDLEEAMRRQSYPVLIVLEDLHWAGTESIKLLSWLAVPIRSLSVLIVGTYRGDEAPGLKDAVDGAREIALSRLSRAEVTELASNILGTKLDDRMQEFLLKETEGNSFFIVETLRVLAEHAGSLDSVGSEGLPDYISSSGMRRIFERRLERLSKADVHALQIAAVVGRVIEPNILAVLVPDLDIDNWAARCLREAVFENHNGGYRFTHEKLREYLLGSAGEERRQIHRSVAQALEASPLQDSLPTTLAYHWGQAGEPNKEAYYDFVAAEQTLAGGAVLESVGYLKDAAKHLADGAQLPTAEIPAEAAIEARLGEAYYQLGNLAECTAHSRRAIRLMGGKFPSTQFGTLMSAVVEFAKVLVGRTTGQRSSIAVEISRAQLHLTDIYFYALQALPATWSMLRAVNESRSRGDEKELAQGYAFLSVLSASIESISRGYELKSLLASRASTDPRHRGFVYIRLAVTKITRCDWMAARRQLGLAEKTAKRSGDLRLIVEQIIVVALVDLFTGDFKAAAAGFTEAQDFSRRTDNRQIECWGAQFRSVCLIRMGRSEEVRALTAPMFAVANDPYMKIERFTTHSLLALVNQRAGETATALGHIEEALTCLSNMPPIAYWLNAPFPCLLEAMFEIAAVDPDGPIDNKKIQRVLDGLASFARMQKLGEPTLALWQGIDLVTKQRTQKAIHKFRYGLKRAEARAMGYEKARIQLELARLGEAAPLEIREMTEWFTRAGCAPELEIIRRHNLADPN